jgi:hypothetical protein
MNSGFRKLALLILVGVLACGYALAQDTDGLIETYNNALANLDAVLTAGAEQGAEAFELLSRSSNQLLSLSLDTASESLTASLEQVLERARIAVQNQSQTDLVVQTAVLRGGFQRIVYDSALGAAVQGNLELAQARLAQLGADLNLPEATLAAVAAASVADEMRFAMEAGIADVVAQGLQVATSLAETDTAQAYQVLAASYGTFLLVQDSPRARSDMNESFIAAANALVAEENEAVVAELAELGNDFVLLENAALAGQPQVPQRPGVEGPPEAAPSGESGDPAVLPSSAGTDATPVETQPVETQPVETPVEAVPAASAVDTGEGAAVEGTATDLTLEELEVLLAEQQRAEAIELLRAEIAGYGVAADVADDLASRLYQNGFSELAEVVAGLYATSAKAAVAIEVGDEARTKGLVGDLALSYRDHLAPVLRVLDPSLHSQTEQLIGNVLDSLALRLQDVVVLVGQVAALDDALDRMPLSAAHDAIVTTALVWSGLVRLVFVIVFGLLAFVPLYLLNLAFGGGNRNWQLVGVALFLLLLPIIYEALAFIGNVVADLSGNEIFNVVASYSIFQNTIAQVVWALVTAAAILFAIAGLYGICVQFGLLGRKRGSSSTGDTRETNVRLSATEPADSLVDWDEEF